MDSSIDYEIIIFVARFRITVILIFAHQPIGIWTSVNNYIWCITYPMCGLQNITKNCRYNDSTPFKHMSYEMTIGENQCHRS